MDILNNLTPFESFLAGVATTFIIGFIGNIIIEIVRLF